jgi:hypothetical protein
MTMNSTPKAMTGVEHSALTRLLQIASGDTGQSRRCADFLLAWWNAGQCGGFDLTSLWGLDDSICNDMHVVFGYIARAQHYPDTLGLGPEFEAVVRMWRPELVESPR